MQRIKRGDCGTWIRWRAHLDALRRLGISVQGMLGSTRRTNSGSGCGVGFVTGLYVAR